MNYKKEKKGGVFGILYSHLILLQLSPTCFPSVSIPFFSHIMFLYVRLLFFVCLLLFVFFSPRDDKRKEKGEKIKKVTLVDFTCPPFTLFFFFCFKRREPRDAWGGGNAV